MHPQTRRSTRKGTYDARGKRQGHRRTRTISPLFWNMRPVPLTTMLFLLPAGVSSAMLLCAMLLMTISIHPLLTFVLVFMMVLLLYKLGTSHAPSSLRGTVPPCKEENTRNEKI